MTTSKKLVGALAPIALVATALTAQAHAQLGQGFYVGLNTGSSFVTNQAENHFSFNGDGSGSFLYHDESSQRGFNLGAAIGWNFYCDCHYVMGLEFSADWYFNEADYTTEFPINVHENWKDKYALNLTFRPGVLINESTLLYAQLGVAWTCFESETHFNNAADFGGGVSFAGNFEQDENLWGWVLGAGIQKQVCDNFSMFAQYTYTYYNDDECLDDLRFTGPEGQSARWHNREFNLDTNTFKVGLIFTF